MAWNKHSTIETTVKPSFMLTDIAGDVRRFLDRVEYLEVMKSDVDPRFLEVDRNNQTSVRIIVLGHRGENYLLVEKYSPHENSYYELNFYQPDTEDTSVLVDRVRDMLKKAEKRSGKRHYPNLYEGEAA